MSTATLTTIGGQDRLRGAAPAEGHRRAHRSCRHLPLSGPARPAAVRDRHRCPAVHDAEGQMGMKAASRRAWPISRRSTATPACIASVEAKSHHRRDEKGTTAAAATVIGMEVVGGCTGPDPTQTISPQVQPSVPVRHPGRQDRGHPVHGSRGGPDGTLRSSPELTRLREGGSARAGSPGRSRQGASVRSDVDRDRECPRCRMSHRGRGSTGLGGPGRDRVRDRGASPGVTLAPGAACSRSPADSGRTRGPPGKRGACRRRSGPRCTWGTD